MTGAFNHLATLQKNEEGGFEPPYTSILFFSIKGTLYDVIILKGEE